MYALVYCVFQSSLQDTCKHLGKVFLFWVWFCICLCTCVSSCPPAAVAPLAAPLNNSLQLCKSTSRFSGLFEPSAWSSALKAPRHNTQSHTSHTLAHQRGDLYGIFHWFEMRTIRKRAREKSRAVKKATESWRRSAGHTTITYHVCVWLTDGTGRIRSVILSNQGLQIIHY